MSTCPNCGMSEEKAKIIRDYRAAHAAWDVAAARLHVAVIGTEEYKNALESYEKINEAYLAAWQVYKHVG